MADARPSLRERRRTETQCAIQAHAVRLFDERGFEAVTVNEVATASGVSPMTVYRHFATKEDLVLTDELGLRIAERISGTRPEAPLVARIGQALVEVAAEVTDAAHDPDRGSFLLTRLRLMVSTPAIRARHLDNQLEIQRAIVDAISGGDDPDEIFRTTAAAGACMAALYVALMRWVDDDGESDLAELIQAALDAAFDQTT